MSQQTDLVVQEWQIWHTYSTFFGAAIADLDRAATSMVRSGLLECAVHSDGDFYWRAASAVERGRVDVHMAPDRKRADIAFAPRVQRHFVEEAVFEAAYLSFTEMRQLGQVQVFPAPYFRGFVGECRLASADHDVRVYPVIKLYASGVMLVEMRVISPERDVGLEEFVENYVNLYKCRFTDVSGPPGLALLAQRGRLFYEAHRVPLLQRAMALRLLEGHRAYIRENTRTEASGDFEFELAPLWKAAPQTDVETCGTAQLEDSNRPIAFQELAHAIIAAAGIALSPMHEGAGFLILGQREPLPLGEYWVARPHIHITRFHEQMETAEKNEQRHGEAFGWIMARLVGKPSALGRQYLPRDARPFSDFAAYIAPQASLWVWSGSGLRLQEPWALSSGSHLVYENQPKAEILDYGYMLTRRLAHLAGRLGSPSDVLRAHQDLVDLKLGMMQPSHFGETRDLLLQGWKAMGVPELQELAAESLGIRHAQRSAAEEQKTARWEVILTIAFGILAVPTLATEVVEPVWHLCGIAQPSDTDAAKLLFTGIALLCVVITLLLTRCALVRRATHKG